MWRWNHRLGLLRAVVVLVFLASVLAACGFEQPSEPAQTDQSGGGLAPETVAKNFFDDLRTAMNDKQITNDDRRSKWVEQLSNYFAPAERDDMRIALSTALDNFVGGLGKLSNSEELMLDIKFDGIEVVSEEDDRALVRPINGSIYLLITRTTDTGAVVNLWEQSNPLNTIIGNPDGAVPVVRIGRTWFLTEG